MENTSLGNPPDTFGSSASEDDVLSKTTAGAHSVVSSIADAADEATRKAKPAIDHVAAVAHQVVDKVAASAAPAVEWIGEQSDNLIATKKKLVTNTSACVAANPLVSVGMAAVAGFLIGRLTRR